METATGPYGAGGAQTPWTYAYNEIGNLMCNPQVSTCSSVSPNYTYPTSGASSVRPHAVTQAGSNIYGYDGNGNMTSGAGRTIAYNSENRPTTVTLGGVTTTFVYDGDGGRVKKTTGGVTTTYIGKLYECSSAGGCSKYLYAGNRRIALKPAGAGSTIYYYHPDHLGSTGVMTTATGALHQRTTYFPFGKTRTTTAIFDEGYMYTGQMLDDSTDLYFYNARYYDPMLGRFIQADSIVPTRRNPQSLNRYSYVMNNPINYNDPSGHIGDWWNPVKAVQGAADGVREGLSNTADSVRNGLHSTADSVRNGVSSTGDSFRNLSDFQQALVGLGAKFLVSPVLGYPLLAQSKWGRGYLAAETVFVIIACASTGGCLSSTSVEIELGGGNASEWFGQSFETAAVAYVFTIADRLPDKCFGLNNSRLWLVLCRTGTAPRRLSRKLLHNLGAEYIGAVISEFQAD